MYTAKWKEIIYLGKKFNYFLVLAIPYLYQIEKSLQASLKSYPQIAHWLDNDVLEAFIYHQAEARILPIILPSCTLEMHVARRHRRLNGRTSTERFNYFIRALGEEDNRDAILQKYPIMLQKLQIVAKQIIDTSKEFFKHLSQDYKEVNAVFLKGQAKDLRLQAISASGDRHQGGRSVLILNFINKKDAVETNLVYKPRTLNIDSSFQNFLKKFNENSGAIALKTLSILDKKSHGYCEFVAVKDCNNTTEVADFYFRLGMLFMLCYLFLGSDLHRENILAEGAYPVLIDYECLLGSPIIFKKNRKVDRHFVSYMHLLPLKEATDIPDQYLDVSGMNSDEDIPTLYCRYVNIGKDTMYKRYVKSKLLKQGNRPQLDGRAVSVSDYEDDFLRGFKTAYQVLLDHSNILLQTSLLEAFKGVKIRIVPRNTETYSMMLFEQHFPQNLLNERVNRLHLHKLNRIKKAMPSFKAFVPSEMADIATENIPFFYAMSDDNKIYNSERQALAITCHAGFERLLEHCRENIHPKDMQQQSELIEASFLASHLNDDTTTTTLLPHTPFVGSKHLWSLKTEKMRASQLAYTVLDNLMGRSLRNGENVIWPYFAVLGRGKGMYNLEMTSFDLYDGLAGILLPFAYAGVLGQRKDYQSFSNACLKTLRTYFYPAIMPYYSLGFSSGLGGILYLYRLLQGLGYPINLKKDVIPILQVFPKCWAADRSFDWIDGITGGIAGCLAWYGHLPDELVIGPMKGCVQHLLNYYPNPAKLPKGYSLPATQPLLGMAHGLTGMIWILSRCNAILRDPKLHLWIKKALGYEREQFKAHKGLWPDYRKNLDPDLVLANKTREAAKLPTLGWCSGSPGIGLAKIATVAPYKDRQFNTEIRQAAKHILNAGLRENDCLCHGNLGNLELLVALANHTKKTEDSINARGFAQAICKQLANKIKHPSKEKPLIPGLMMGDAGIAYGLLRIAWAEEVPNILAPPL